MIEILLPFPPSLNHYLTKSVRFSKGKAFVHVAVSARGVKYKADVLAIILKKRLMRSFSKEQRLRVDLSLFPPDARKRDVDNFPKVLLDSLTSARLWEDDSQVDKLTITRCWPRRPEGACVVRVSEFSGADSCESSR